MRYGSGPSMPWIGPRPPYMPRISVDPPTQPSASPSPAPVPPTPEPPDPEPVAVTPTAGVLIADPSIIIFDEEAVPIEVMSDLLFEQVGGQEIINISRNDLVNGQSVIYHPIKNLQEVYLRYNTKNIVALQQSSVEIFKGFPIKFVNHIPIVGNGPDGQNVYLDPLTGNVVVEVVNITRNEQVDVEIINTVSSFDDTIYVEVS